MEAGSLIMKAIATNRSFQYVGTFQLVNLILVGTTCNASLCDAELKPLAYCRFLILLFTSNMVFKETTHRLQQPSFAFDFGYWVVFLID